MFKSRLFWKIFASIWLSLVLTVAGVSVALMVHNQARFEEARLINQNPRAGFANRLLALSIEAGGELQARQLIQRWPVRESQPPLVVDENGQDLIGRPVPPEILAQAKGLVDDEESPRGARLAKTPLGVSYLVFQPGRGRPPPVTPHLSPDMPATVLVTALLASLLVSVFLARHITRPVGQLRDAFEALASGHLESRIVGNMTERRDEIGELGRDFDKMAAQLEQLMEARDRLLHDVSHELRSPLARMQTAVGLAHQQPARVASALERIELEASRLDELVGELLTLARLESGKQTAGDEYIELRELLASVVDDARFEADASGRSIEFFDDLKLDQDVVLHASGTLLHRAFDNVIRNALHHTPDGSKVEVSLHAGAERLHIVVRDHGPGLPEDQLASVFEPFFRSQNANGSGFGLGLAIARRAIEAHGGRIVAENAPSNGGLQVLIELPAGSQ